MRILQPPFLQQFSHTDIVLASGSPRRKQLLEMAGFKITVYKTDVDESHPPHISSENIPEYLAQKKAQAAYKHHPDALIIAADTIVWHNQTILEKPADAKSAKKMLSALSGQSHRVITGVAIAFNDIQHHFSTHTQVLFKELDPREIEYYIEEYQPFDKAGSYGIQEWIGLIGIASISGCYYNVMGLPVSALINALKTQSFFSK